MEFKFTADCIAISKKPKETLLAPSHNKLPWEDNNITFVAGEKEVLDND